MQNSIFCFTVVSIRFSLNVIIGTFQLFEKHIKNHLHFYRQEMLESSPRYQISGSQMFITLTKVVKSGFFIAQNLSLET